MKPLHASVVLLTSAVVFAGFISALPQEPSSRVDDLVRASHFIFAGRVLKTSTVNLKVLSPGETTALVRVDELLDAPPSLVGIKGQVVTLELIRPGEANSDDTAVYFTNGILFGEHLEVKEVGRMPLPADAADLRRQISTVRARTEEEKVQARANSALLIVTGKVLEIRPLEKTRPISEHEPEWAEATVQVESVEKGSWKGRTVTVDFPLSLDERWMLSPKFHPGQQGVWLLHSEENLGLPAGGFFALSPLDFHGLDKRQMILRLIT